MPKSTHTLADLEIPKELWDVIYNKLDAAGYQHALDDEEQTIDMTGIQLTPETTNLRYRALDDVVRIRELETAIRKIWDAYSVCVSNGAVFSGTTNRHIIPAIYDANEVLSRKRKVRTKKTGV